MNARARIGFALLLPALAFLLGGLSACGIFDTRDPQSPSQLSSSFVPPTDPPIVFQNLTGAFTDQSALNYVRCFADSSTGLPPFRFDAEPNARLVYSGAFSVWNRTSEQQYFEAMKAQLTPGAGMTLEFVTLTPTSLSSDSAQYDSQYRLTVPHTRSGVPTVAVGRSVFWLASDRSRNWAIVRWTDLELKAGDFTWSDLKGTFGQ
jgi:hypothetical protein